MEESEDTKGKCWKKCQEEADVWDAKSGDIYIEREKRNVLQTTQRLFFPHIRVKVRV